MEERTILYARTNNELGACLRMLYAKKLSFIVEVCENQNRKIYFEVKVEADPQTFARVKEEYRILIS